MVSTRADPFTPGDHVVADRSLGVARIAAMDAGRLRLQYFESVVQPVAREEWVPAAHCRRETLARETRVYFTDRTGHWRVGRVTGGGPRRYAVRLPNTASDLPIDGHRLHVRWYRPVSDPMAVLIAGASESPYYRDARAPFMSSTLRQRAACAGMDALLSSAIEHYPHQIRTASTILEDPVQRYLLADEVGLGKTIEAGLVLRQYLSDEPKGSVVVLAPELLRHQWRNELRQRFFIDDFADASITITSHDSPQRWSRYHGAGLLIVDEAHVLAEAALPGQGRYGALQELAHSAERLLLLSATPALHQGAMLLALLNLLDPALYRWEQQEAFRARMSARRELASCVYGLSADLEFYLPDMFDQIRALVPADEILSGRINACLQLLGPEGDLLHDDDRPELARRVEQVRAHLSETYRLHRRIIRHRRSRVTSAQSEINLPYLVTGRAQAENLMDAADVRLPCDEVAQRWREQLADNAGTSDRGVCATALAIVAVRAANRGRTLEQLLRFRVHRDAVAADRSGLTPEECDALTAIPALPGEGLLLSELEQMGDLVAEADAALFRQLTRLVTSRRRTVVFAGPGESACDIAAGLKRTGTQAVHSHLRSLHPEAVEHGVAAWLADGGVLVCDDSGEAGRNFQAADLIVHYSLPRSPNQLEQRIGRADRYGDGDPASQVVVTDVVGDDGFHGAWYRLLRDGFSIFERSVSALQYAVDKATADAWREALESGVGGLLAAVPDVQQALATERRSIDEIDTLEASFESTDGRRDLMTELAVLEQDWPELKKALDGLTIGQSGGLRFARTSTADGRIFTYGVDENPPLVPAPLLLRAFGTRKAAGYSRLQFSGAFNRTAALNRPGTRIHRIGTKFIDGLAFLCEVDDRGQATTLWRFLPHWPDDDQVFFGLDFQIEADIGPALSLVAAVHAADRALRRRAARSFPPSLARLWLPAFADHAVSDSRTLVALQRRYREPRQGKDWHLDGEMKAPLVDLLGGPSGFERACHTAAKAGPAALAREHDLVQRCEAAAGEAQRQIAVAAAQAAARHRAGNLLSDVESALIDVEVTKALLRGISEPDMRLIGVTCTVLSSKPLSQRVSDG